MRLLGLLFIASVLASSGSGERFIVSLQDDISQDQVMNHLADLQKEFRVHIGEPLLQGDALKSGLGSVPKTDAELNIVYLYDIPGFKAYLLDINENAKAKSGSELSVADRFLRMSKDGLSSVKLVEKSGKASLAVSYQDDQQQSMLSMIKASLNEDIYSKVKSSFSPSGNVSDHANLEKSLSNQGLSTWNLARICSRVSSALLGSSYSYDSAAGSSVDVYIIDSGLDAGHFDFTGGRASTAVDFSGDGLVDNIGHGTHVAGIIGGTLFGVAKSAKLIGVKVFGTSGTADWGSILAGINWAFQQARTSGRKSIINLSLRGDYSESVNLAVSAIVATGVPVAVAAGNDGQDACSYSPGSSSAPLCVGASMAGDLFFGATNAGPCVDILAPGKDILSDWTGSPYNVRFLSGTSMATPHVSGVLALLWSQRPWLSSSDLMNLVKAIATSNLISSVPANTVNLLLYNQLE